MENINNILVTGGGAPGAAGILKALRQDKNLKLFSCDTQDDTVGKFLADSYFPVLKGDDENYINDLLNKCLALKIAVILPLTTKELEPLSANKELFKKNGIEVIVSEFQALTVANNKGLLYTHLKTNKIEVPKFSIVHTVQEFNEAADLLDYPKKEIIFKPCIGNGSRGFRIVSNQKSEHDLLFNEKPNSTYISVEKAIEILGEHSFPELLVSEYLPGQEYTVDCLVHNGETKLVIPRSREKMNNGISIAGTIEKNEEVIAYCTKILSTLKLDGLIGIQVKYSKQNEPLLVEINPRIQGTTVACIGAGANLALLAVHQKIKETIQLPNIKWDTHFIRFYEELFYQKASK